MLSTGLPVSRLVKVDVSLTTPAVIAPAINTCLLLGTSTVINAVERVRKYDNITEVAHDFGTAAEEYLGADLWFSQSPQPDNLYIGRWIKAPSAGLLVGRPLTTAEQAIALWKAVVAGGFHVAIDGAAAADVVGLTFAAAANLNAVAAAITTAMTGRATMTWDATNMRFQMVSTTTGTTSAVSYLSAPTTGTDISAMLGMRATDANAHSIAGSAGESALTAATIIDGMYSALWYALVCPSAIDNDHEDLAAYCEAADPPHYYGVTTQDPAVLDPASTVDIAAELSALGYNKTAVQYSRSSAYAIMSYLGRILTTAWDGQNTTMTLMYKQEPGVAGEILSATQADVAMAKFCNLYANYANGTTLIQYGTSASGEFSDTIIGADALAGDVQTAVFNVLYTTPTKIPQTDPGMQLLLNAVTAICANYVSNGYLAEGTWNAPGFGTLKSGDLLSLGFYVFAPSMLLQSAADRAARKAPLLQIAAKCAGAIHTASVLIFVNQ
jgi:hypothetical protein